MKIIAFTGPGGAGKNTAAEGTGTEWDVITVAFAAPLYEICLLYTSPSPRDS